MTRPLPPGRLAVVALAVRVASPRHLLTGSAFGGLQARITNH